MTNTQNPLQDLDKLLLSDLATLPVSVLGYYILLLQYYKIPLKIDTDDKKIARMMRTHTNGWVKAKNLLIDSGFLIKKEDGLYPLHYANLTQHNIEITQTLHNSNFEVTKTLPQQYPEVFDDNPLILSSLNNPSYTSPRLTPSDQFLKIDFKEKIKKEKKIRKKPDFENPDDDPNFVDFRTAYPPNKHEDWPRTFLEWKKITKKQGVNHEELTRAAKNYAAKFAGEANPMPNAAHNWLMRGSWRDCTDAKIRARAPTAKQIPLDLLCEYADQQAANIRGSGGNEPNFSEVQSAN